MKESNSPDVWLGDLYKSNNITLFIINSYFKSPLLAQIWITEIKNWRSFPNIPLSTLLGWLALIILYLLIFKLSLSVRSKESRKVSDGQILS